MEVLTGLAGVSSRTCRLPAPQTDAEAATAWIKLHSYRVRVWWVLVKERIYLA